MTDRQAIGRIIHIETTDAKSPGSVLVVASTESNAVDLKELSVLDTVQFTGQTARARGQVKKLSLSHGNVEIAIVMLGTFATNLRLDERVTIEVLERWSGGFRTVPVGTNIADLTSPSP